MGVTDRRMVVGRSWPPSCMFCSVHYIRSNVTRFWKLLLLLLLLLTLQPYMGFGLLPQVFQPFISLTSWIQFLSFSFFRSFIASSLHLLCGRPLVLIPVGFQSVILTSFRSSILLTCPHQFILYAFICI